MLELGNHSEDDRCEVIGPREADQMGGAGHDDESRVTRRAEHPSLLESEVVEASVHEPHRYVDARERRLGVELADGGEHRRHDVEGDSAREHVVDTLWGEEESHHEVIECTAAIGQASDQRGQLPVAGEADSNRAGAARSGDESVDAARMPCRELDGEVAPEAQTDEQPGRVR